MYAIYLSFSDQVFTETVVTKGFTGQILRQAVWEIPCGCFTEKNIR